MNWIVVEVLDPFLGSLAGWSIRWGVLIIVLGALLRLRPPRRATTRHLLCVTTLAAGLILPMAPRWSAPWPTAGSTRIPSSSDVRPPALIPVMRNDRPTARPTQAEPAVALGPGLAWSLFSLRLRVGLATVWLAGVVTVLSRLIIGRTILARLRVESRPVAGDLLERSRREIGSRRAVTLASHPAIGSPVLLGGGSPMILVPDDWKGLPEADRWACLLHELAHLGRRDDLTRLAAELARAPFWFHPSISWLLARLDREAELACDEAAVGWGVAPRDLARLLLTFARKPRRLDLRGLPLDRYSLPFLNRDTVSIRIHRLLEHDMSRTMIPASKHANLGLAAALAALALAIGGAGPRVLDPALQAPAPPPSEGATRSFAVAVKDHAGRPVEGAIVVANGHGSTPWSDVARTDAAGLVRFDRELEPTMSLRATREGYGFAKIPYLDPAKVSGPIDLTLPEARSLTGSVVDEGGQPIAGAEVLVVSVHNPYSIPPGQFSIALAQVSLANDNSPLLTTKTDRDGRFLLEGVPASKIISLRASAEGHASVSFEASEAENPMPVVLAPGARVVGRVLSEVPGVSLENLSVQIFTKYGGATDTDSSTVDTAKINAEGRFEARALRPGRASFNLVGYNMADAPWTFHVPGEVRLAPGSVPELTIRIVAGVALEGRVVSADGKPATQVRVTGHRRRDSRSSSVPVVAFTNADGIFRLRVPAGETLEYTVDPKTGPYQPTGVLTVPAGVARYSLPTTKLAPPTAR